MIPTFREDGYLPEGLHLAGEAEVIARFGSATSRRRLLALRLRRVVYRSAPRITILPFRIKGRVEY